MRPTTTTTALYSLWTIALSAAVLAIPAAGAARQIGAEIGASVVLRSASLAPVATGPERSVLTIDGLYFETSGGRTAPPAARQHPDLKALDAEVSAWFDARKTGRR